MPRSAQILYCIAAGLALAAVMAHEFIGAPMVFEPIDSAELPSDVVWLHHASWHFGTVAVLSMIAMFLIASFVPGQLMMAVIATSMSVGFAAVGIGTAVFGDPVLWTTPAPYAWAVVSVFGLVGLNVAWKA